MCSAQSRDGGYVHLYLSGPIYTSKPLKCSLAGRSGQAGKLSFRWFFVCLQVMLATERITQLVVCARLCDQAEAGLRACKSWSGAELFQLTPGLIWSWHWRGCYSAASSCGLASRSLVWLCLHGQQHPAPVCGRGSEQAHDGYLSLLQTRFSCRPENTSHCSQ